MRNFCLSIVFSFCAVHLQAQTTANDSALLSRARAAYDAPFSRNLKSFDCALDFNWKQHWTETIRVGDEGTDDEIAKLIQPIRNRVTVSREDAVVSSSITEEQMDQLPYKGMAEGLLKHAVRFSLRNWLTPANNALLPKADTPVHFESSGSGYKLKITIQNFDTVMMLTHNMSLQSRAVNGSDSNREEFEFHPGPQGFLVDTWAMGEDGDFKPGNRLIFTYTYQSVGGFQLPAQVVLNRESHHEVWRYTLTDCKVTTDK